jgi:hypothetical protein
VIVASEDVLDAKPNETPESTGRRAAGGSDPLDRRMQPAEGRDRHQLINGSPTMARRVVVASSYLPEIMAISDRILVSRQSKVVEEYSALEATDHVRGDPLTAVCRQGGKRSSRPSGAA